MKTTFEAPEAIALPAALAAVTGGTVEVNLWSPSLWTPILAQYATVPQQYVLTASGVLTLPVTTPGTTAFTARLGTSAAPASNTIIGAASAAAQGTTQTAVPWWMDGLLTVRALGLPGANSTVHFRAMFHCPLGYQAAGVSGAVLIGGTATVDLSIAQGLAVSVTPSVSGQSFTVEQISWRSLN